MWKQPVGPQLELMGSEPTTFYSTSKSLANKATHMSYSQQIMVKYFQFYKFKSTYKMYISWIHKVPPPKKIFWQKYKMQISILKLSHISSKCFSFISFKDSKLAFRDTFFDFTHEDCSLLLKKGIQKWCHGLGRKGICPNVKRFAFRSIVCIIEKGILRDDMGL